MTTDARCQRCYWFDPDSCKGVTVEEGQGIILECFDDATTFKSWEPDRAYSAGMAHACGYVD